MGVVLFSQTDMQPPLSWQHRIFAESEVDAPQTGASSVPQPSTWSPATPSGSLGGEGGEGGNGAGGNGGNGDEGGGEEHALLVQMNAVS